MDEFERHVERVVAELRRRQETVHERVACPKCGVARGERCVRVGSALVPFAARLKHPHSERLRADGLYER